MNLHLDLNEPKIIQKLTNDRFGLFAAVSWKKHIDPYTPYSGGNLIRNVEFHPWEIHYKEKYAHYIYTGEVYVDPDYGAGGFYDPIYGWYSRPGVKKIPSGRSFKQFTTNTNPDATDHWDMVAEQSGQKNKLYRTLNNALQSGQF